VAQHTTRPGVVRATAGRVALAIAIDALVVIALLALVVAVSRAGVTATILAILALIVALAAQAHGIVVRGRSLGWVIVGVRAVTEDDDAPIGWGRIARAPAAFAADLRSGRDPIAFAAVPPVLRSGLAASAAPDVRPRRGAPAPTRLAVVIDGGRRLPLAGRMLLGRNPTPELGAVLVPVPDLSRTISKTHARLEVEPDGTVFATDLASTNGSAIEVAGRLVELSPQLRYPLSPGAVLHLGAHAIVLERITAG
jgi:hypothetical protein